MRLRSIPLLFLLAWLSGSGFVAYFDIPMWQNVYASSLIDTTTNSNTWRYATPSQDKTFYAAGLVWVFYDDGTNMAYRTSSDNGLTWSAKTSIRASGYEDLFSIYFNGTYIHYVTGLQTGLGGMYYRRGTPNSDGTITWSAAEQTVAAAGLSYYEPTVRTDSNGYPYISYGYASGGSYKPYVTKSSVNDGTWLTAGGYPLKIYDVGPNRYTGLVSLTNGRMAMYWYHASICSNNLWISVYNGSAWRTAVNRSTYPSGSVCFIDAVSNGDDVELVRSDNYGSGSRAFYGYFNYTANSLNAFTNLNLAGSYNPSASIVKNGTDTLIIYKKNSTAIYTKKLSSGVWASPLAYVTGESSLTATGAFYAFNSVYSGFIGFVYGRDTVPRQIVFATPILNGSSLAANYTLSGLITNRDFDPILFANKKYYHFMANFTLDGAPIDTVKLRFSDGFHNLTMAYSNVTSTFSLDSASAPYLTLDTANSYANKTISGTVRILVAHFIVKLTDLIADANNVDLYAWGNDTAGGTYGWDLVQNNYFDIYNLGGATSTIVSGVAGHIPGGDTYEIYGFNGSSIVVNQTWWHLQQYHAQFSLAIHDNLTSSNGLNSQFWQDSAHATGSDLRWTDPSDWQVTINWNGWDQGHKKWVSLMTVQLSMYNGNAGADDRWTTLNASWWSGGQFIKSDLITAFIENDPQAQIRLYLDFWFNQANASTVHGGRVTSLYYGMHKEAFAWWGNWSPALSQVATGQQIVTNGTVSSMFGVNKDYNGTTIQAKDIEIINQSFNLTRPHTAVNGPVQPEWKMEVKDFVISEFNIEQNSIIKGVNTPVRIDTNIPDLPNTGFWTPLYIAIGNLAAGIWAALASVMALVWAQIAQRWPWFTGFWDNLVAAVTSFSTLLANVFPWLIQFTTFLATIVGYITWPIRILQQTWSFVVQAFAWVPVESMPNIITLMVIIYFAFPIMEAVNKGDWNYIEDYIRKTWRIFWSLFIITFHSVQFLVHTLIQLVRG